MPLDPLSLTCADSRFKVRRGFISQTNDVYPTGILIQSNNVTVINGTIEGFWNGVLASSSQRLIRLLISREWI